MNKSPTNKKVSLSAHDWHCLLSCARAFYSHFASLLRRQPSLSLCGSSCLLSETFNRPVCGLSLPNFPLPILWVSCCRKRSSLQNLKAPINFIVALKVCQQLCEFLASWTNLYLGVKGLIVLTNERHYLVGSLQSGELPYHLNNSLSWLHLSFKGSQI